MGCASSAPLAAGGQAMPAVANDAPSYDLKQIGESTLTSKLRENAEDLMDSDHIKQVIGENANEFKDGAAKMMNDVGETVKEKVSETIATAEEKLSSTFTSLTSAAEETVEEMKDVDTMVEDLEQVLPPAEMETSGKNSPEDKQQGDPTANDFQMTEVNHVNGDPICDAQQLPDDQVELVGVIITEIQVARLEDDGDQVDVTMPDDLMPHGTRYQGTDLLDKPEVPINDDVIGSPPPMPRPFDGETEISQSLPTRPVSSAGSSEESHHFPPVDNLNEGLMEGEKEKEEEKEKDSESKAIDDKVNEIVENSIIEVVNTERAAIKERNGKDGVEENAQSENIENYVTASMDKHVTAPESHIYEEIKENSISQNSWRETNKANDDNFIADQNDNDNRIMQETKERNDDDDGNNNNNNNNLEEEDRKSQQENRLSDGIPVS